MKCEECGSSNCYVDAERDLFWCKSCGYIESVDYKAIPQPIATCKLCEGFFMYNIEEGSVPIYCEECKVKLALDGHKRNNEVI